MSAYMSFFLRGKDDRFYPLGTYCRNTAIYEMFAEIGYSNWGSVTPLTSNRIDEASKEAHENKVLWAREAENTKEKIKLIGTFNDPPEEKISLIEEYTGRVKDYNDKVKELEETISFCWFLSEILEDVRYGADNDIDINNYLYVGIEVGQPTVDDITTD